MKNYWIKMEKTLVDTPLSYFQILKNIPFKHMKLIFFILLI